MQENPNPAIPDIPNKEMTASPLNQRHEQYDPQKYRLRLLPVLMAVAAFYAFAVLLNANGIQRNIELMQYGKLRDFYLSAFSPVSGLSNRLGLTSLRTMIEKSIGNPMHNEKINP